MRIGDETPIRRRLRPWGAFVTGLALLGGLVSSPPLRADPKIPRACGHPCPTGTHHRMTIGRAPYDSQLSKNRPQAGNVILHCPPRTASSGQWGCR